MRVFLYKFLMGLATMVRPKPQALSLEELKKSVMAYQHPDLIERLIQKFELSKEQAEAAFMGMKQYLYLAGTSCEGLSPQSEIVDEAWHNFMLFSLDYQKFCMKYFGRFVHHQPFNAAKRAANDGQGSHNTKLALEKEFGVLSQIGKGEGVRCDACRGDCACSDCKGADRSEVKVMADCINVPSGECSGTTNDQLSEHGLIS